MDYLVIGAGPAGLQLGWFLHRAGRDYRILEAGATPGTFYRTFPRHRRMLSINKPHTGRDDPERNLRMDWNSLLSDDPGLLFTRYTGRYFPDAGDYVRYLTDFAARHGLNVSYDSRVTNVARDELDRFVVTDQRGRVFRAERVIVATGFGRPYIPPIPGIETTERYVDVSVDPADFTDQRVLVIGKGNAAFETADNLAESAAVIHVVGPHSINVAGRAHLAGHLRAADNNLLDTHRLETQNTVLDAVLQQIEHAGDEFQITLSYARRDKTVTLTYDRVITCTGFQMDATIFDETCRPELAISERFPALTSEWESVNVPDLYFAGTLTQVRDFKKNTSAYIHGFRYGARALHRMFERKYQGREWPHGELPAAADALADAVLARINRSSALFLQYGFLCDLIEIEPGETAARYYEELPVDFVHDSVFGSADCYFTITLEYGAGHDAIDPFDVEAGRAREADPGHDDRYLHPVIRHYRRWTLVSVRRLPDDICDDWVGEREYRDPLRLFFGRQLAIGAPLS